MRSPMIPTSVATHGAPVPSTTRPPVITKSKFVCCASLGAPGSRSAQKRTNEESRSFRLINNLVCNRAMIHRGSESGVYTRDRKAIELVLEHERKILCEIVLT